MRREGNGGGGDIWKGLFRKYGGVSGVPKSPELEKDKGIVGVYGRCYLGHVEVFSMSSLSLQNVTKKGLPPSMPPPVPHSIFVEH